MLPKDVDTRILAFCAVGARSRRLVAALRQAGYANALNAGSYDEVAAATAEARRRGRLELEYEEPSESDVEEPECGEPRAFEWFHGPAAFRVDAWHAQQRCNAEKATGREKVVLLGDSLTEAWSVPLPEVWYRAWRLDYRSAGDLGPGRAGVWKGLGVQFLGIWIWLVAWPLGPRARLASLTWFFRRMEHARPALDALNNSLGGPGSAIHLGIGGDRTRHCLWRVETGGELDKAISPRLRAVVLLIGLNNILFGEDDPSEVPPKIVNIAKAIEARTPDATTVFVCHLTPVDCVRPAVVTPALRSDVNETLAPLVREARAAGHLRRTEVLSFDEALGSGGKPRSDLTPDRIHLNERGYAALAAALPPAIRHALGRP